MGLAVGDDTTGTVSPLEVVPYRGTEAAAHTILDTAARLQAGCVVLGLPARADGTVGGAARRTEELAAALRRLGLDVATQREFLTTDEARRRARAAGRRARDPVDDIAAQVILEEYLATVDGERMEAE
jgi:putative Holliday junction resolvase